MPLTYSKMPEATSRWACWRSALTVPIRRRLQNAKGSARGITANSAKVIMPLNQERHTAASTKRITMTAVCGSNCWDKSPTVW